MCGTGWDYPGLTNVVDLTFTSNPKLIIHRMSRTTRKFPGKQKGFYVYCADQSKKDGKSVYYLTRALELMTEKGIRDYDGKVWRNFVTEEKKRTRFSIKDYFNIDKKFLKIKNRTLLRMSLMDIRNRTSVDNTLAPFLMVFKEKRKADYAELIKKLRTLKTGYDNNPIFIRKVLKFFKKEYLTIYNLAY
jgi:hypothetical protein